MHRLGVLWIGALWTGAFWTVRDRAESLQKDLDGVNGASATV